MSEYLEFCENLATKKVNDKIQLYVDLYCNQYRQKVYVITAQKEDNAVEIGRAYTNKQAKEQFRTAYFVLKTDEEEKSGELVYGR